jgi:hypothetical protein
MIESILVVLSRPMPGRDADFNDWYGNIHIRDAMRFRGSIATQRFALSDRQIVSYRNPSAWKYLALYEVCDTALFTREHFDAVGTARMHISRAFDHSVAYDYYFFLCEYRDNAPGLPFGGRVVMQQMQCARGRESEFRSWYRRQILDPALIRPGVRCAALLQFVDVGQMLAESPRANFTAIYRLSEPHAMNGWEGPDALARAPTVVSDSIETSCWDELSTRLLKDAVLNPTPEMVDSEQAARERMGADVIAFDAGAMRPGE